MARRVTWEEDRLWHKRADLRRHLIYLRELLEERGGPEQQPNIADDLAQSQLEYDRLELEHQALRAEREAGDQRRARLLEFARERVVEFGGGGDLAMMQQMSAGTRITGNCCICGAVLSDPISVEYGIGPVCRTKHSRAIAGWVAAHHEAAAKAATSEQFKFSPVRSP
jgi:hypothetical protein